ncbi:MFS transporter [Tsukamurella sp. NPDC003166]|uniref:MFS transporter n=1 Tax=Tsukamurella sp. NPDC003166 TaxID=3154444 RepID=UPI0033B65CAC
MNDESTRGTPTTLGYRTVLSGLLMVELVSGLIQGIVPTMTPALGKQLGVSTAALNWISSIFLLSSVVWVPVLSKLGDQYGHRRLLRIAVAFLALGSVLVAVAPNFAVLLLGRAFQGALLACLPLEMALVRDRLDPERARSAIAVLLGVLTAGFSLGYVLGGVLLEFPWSAQHALLIPAAATVLVILAPMTMVPESSTTNRAPAGMDWTGACLLTVGLGAVMMSLAFGPKQGWTSPLVVGLLIGGIAVLAVWLRIELGQRSPLVSVRELARPNVLPLYLSAFLVGMVSFGPLTAFSTFAATPRSTGYGLSLNGVLLGLFLTTLGAGVFLASVIAPRAARRWPQHRVVMAGFVCGAIGFAVLPLAQAHWSTMAAAIVFVGLAEGLVVATLPVMILERLPADSAGISAGMYNVVRTLGGSVMGAIIAIVLAAHTPASGVVTSAGYITVWLVAAALSTAGVVLVVATNRTASATDSLQTINAVRN